MYLDLEKKQPLMPLVPMIMIPAHLIIFVVNAPVVNANTIDDTGPNDDATHLFQ